MWLDRHDPGSIETGGPSLLRDQFVSREACARNIRRLQLHYLLMPSLGSKVTENMVRTEQVLSCGKGYIVLHELLWW